MTPQELEQKVDNAINRVLTQYGEALKKIGESDRN